MSIHWVGASHTLLVAEKKVSLISFSGQSLASLLEESLNLGKYKMNPPLPLGEDGDVIARG